MFLSVFRLIKDPKLPLTFAVVHGTVTIAEDVVDQMRLQAVDHSISGGHFLALVVGPGHFVVEDLDGVEVGQLAGLEDAAELGEGGRDLVLAQLVVEEVAGRQVEAQIEAGVVAVLVGEGGWKAVVVGVEAAVESVAGSFLHFSWVDYLFDD